MVGRNDTRETLLRSLFARRRGEGVQGGPRSREGTKGNPGREVEERRTAGQKRKVANLKEEKEREGPLVCKQRGGTRLREMILVEFRDA